MNFCSECYWGKIVELKDGLYVVCTRHKNPSLNNVNAQYWAGIRNVFRKLNAGACTVFKKKDVAENR